MATLLCPQGGHCKEVQLYRVRPDCKIKFKIPLFLLQLMDVEDRGKRNLKINIHNNIKLKQSGKSSGKLYENYM